MPVFLLRSDSVLTAVTAGTAATIASRAIGLLRGVALAWLLPPAEFGLLGVALLIVNVMLPIFSAGLYEGAMRYAPVHEHGGTIRRFGVTTLAVALMLAVIIGLFLALPAGPVGGVLFETAAATTTVAAPDGAGTDMLYAVVVCTIALTAYHVLLGIVKGLRLFRLFAAAEAGSAAVFTALAIAVAVTGLNNAQAVVLAYAVASALAATAMALALFPRLPAGGPLGEGHPYLPVAPVVRYSLWAAGTALLWHALSYYPMWYLLKVATPATVGAFHGARLFTQFLHVGAVMLATVLAANVNRIWAAGDPAGATARLSLLTRLSVVGLIAGAGLLALLRPVAMALLPGSLATARAAYDPLLLFFLLVGFTALITVRLNLLEKPRLVCAAWLIGAIVNVAAAALIVRGEAHHGDAVDVAALTAAAWAGVAGVAAALVACILLSAMAGLPLSRGAVALMAIACGCGAGWPVAVSVAVVVIILAAVTSVIFDAEERRSVTAALRDQPPPPMS